MPVVRISLLKGTPIESKRDLVENITSAVVSSLGKSPETVRVFIEEISEDNVGRGGTLVCDNKDLKSKRKEESS